MPQHSRVTQGQLNSLKLQTVNAMFTVFDREIEARDARDTDLARRLYSSRETLRTVVLELRRAEAAFLKSDRPVAHAEEILGDAVQEVRKARRKLNEMDTVDDGASQVIDLLRRLPPALK